MPDPSAYRSRTQAVRGAARERLRQLREERLSRRGETYSKVSVARPSESESQGLAVSRATSLVTGAWAGEAETDPRMQSPGDAMLTPESAAIPYEQIQCESERSAQERIDQAGETAPVPVGAEDSPIELEAEASSAGDDPCRGKQCPSDVIGTAAACQEGVTQAVAYDDLHTEGVVDATPSSAGQPETSDLLKLPGAGAGLVWMLGQCGITSLEALGRADPDELTERMGLVGQMLDVEGWIGFARAEGGETDRRSLGPV